ncbi:hypothetical protein AB0F05_33670 [Streptomyces microflavus]|uniref:hypothetical protein n=1 Tax=Streptomyces microflavus TaxID=1919 RepID=UPI0033E02286
MSETFWTAVGAIGGTLAFGGVIWQAFLTRGALTVSQLMAADAAAGSTPRHRTST